MMIIVGAFLTLGLVLIGVPKWITFLLIIVLYITYTAIWPAHIIYKSKSIKAIHRYIKSNTTQPLFNYAYALSNDNEQQIELALNQVINDYKNEDMAYIYGANLAIHQNKSSEILKQAAHIEDEDYKNYYIAYANILKGHISDAFLHLDKVQIPWMIHAVKALVEKKNGNLDKFNVEAEKSIESITGIQRYVQHHSMRRLRHS